jgi:hypothetical protein
MDVDIIYGLRDGWVYLRLSLYYASSSKYPTKQYIIYI